jgi:DNA-binding transcriptional LysR family regulator
MELRQLEAFAAVMSSGSMTGAARLLARSQPAVTRLVQELEAEVGHALFTRNGPRVTPTELGFLLHEDVDRLLSGLRQLPQRVEQIARGMQPRMLLAATSAMAVGLMPLALKQVQDRCGPAPVQLRSASPEQVVHAVLTGAAQLGATSLPLEHRGLQVQWIGELPCVAVLPAGDPLARRKQVPLAALARRRLITMSNPYRLRHRLDAELTRAGKPALQADALIETNSSVNAQALARAGLGVALMEPLTARGMPLDGVVVRALDVHIPFFFGVITLQSRQLSEPLQNLAEALLEQASALPGFVRHDPAEHAALLQTAHGGHDTPDPTDSIRKDRS